LYEVPGQEGNEERQGHNHEEWQASYPGSMQFVRHQDVQDREGLAAAPLEELSVKDTERYLSKLCSVSFYITWVSICTNPSVFEDVRKM
jgi:hypothetical protein